MGLLHASIVSQFPFCASVKMRVSKICRSPVEPSPFCRELTYGFAKLGSHLCREFRRFPAWSSLSYNTETPPSDIVLGESSWHRLAHSASVGERTSNRAASPVRSRIRET